MLSCINKSVVITGAESTGKSALTEELSHYFGVAFIPEFARHYIENLNRKYTCKDVEKIARVQIREFSDQKNKQQWLFFSDTWLIITKIWLEEVFGTSPGWLDSEIRKAEIDLFLICQTDLPWVADKVRENGGIKREYLQKRYTDAIKEYGFPYEIISGTDHHRFRNAVKALERHQIVKPNQK